MLVEQYGNMMKENADPRLERYIKTQTMQRLQGKGVFCGMDYVNIKKLKPIGEDINMQEKPITGNLSNYTVKILSKYKKK